MAADQNIPQSAVALPSMHVVVLSMDAHLEGPVRFAERDLRRAIPGLKISLFPASEWEKPGPSQDRVMNAIATANLLVVGMLFLEDQVKPILPALMARAPEADAFVGILSTPDVVQRTRLGKFRMDKPDNGAIKLLKRLRGKPSSSSNGEGQAKILRRLPKILKFIPGTAQDVRSYFLAMQYWLGGSNDNVRNLVAYLIDKYADGPRSVLRGKARVGEPVVYPDTGLYHPKMSPTIAEDLSKLPARSGQRPKVGLLLLRSYALSADTAHYDGVIQAMEDHGLDVVPAFASGLDARPAIDKYFRRTGQTTVEAIVSLTGFSLVGGPAYNDAKAASEVLQDLDVPYLSAHSLEFQSLADWGESRQGLSPVEATIMVAIPELDGATAPTVFGGRASNKECPCPGCARACRFDTPTDHRMMQACPERADALAARVRKMVRLRAKERQDRNVAVVLFNFPPNSGATGTAAYLAVYESLMNLLIEMKSEGYDVELPRDTDDLRTRLTEGNAIQYGADGNVHHRIPTNTHVRREQRLSELEAQWGPAPGRQQADGESIHVLGARFGKVFVGLQPTFGYEGDPMRLLFEDGFAPTHAFCAFYSYLKNDFDADAVIHFGTHGALEFMPGKQAALSADCWPSYLIGDLPNFYFYAANNPSEAALAKRRSAATTISYLTGSVTKADLYRSLADLKGTVERWRALPPEEASQRRSLAVLAQAQATSLDLADGEPPWEEDTEEQMLSLLERLSDYEEALIPDGLHVAGVPMDMAARTDLLLAMAGEGSPDPLPDVVIRDVVAGLPIDRVAQDHGLDKARERLTELRRVDLCLQQDTELTGLIKALDGRFIEPAPGGDVVSSTEVLPTGRNIHGFDPFRLPSAWAVRDGAEQAQRLLDRHLADEGKLPETVAIVLWGADNLKSEGAQIAQALALMGAKPRFDHYGRLAGAELVPLDELDRPRIDVMATLSGIFRDLLPMQTKLLAGAALAAAEADEPEHQNYIRKHALAYQREHGCDLATAALRVFSNADGAYGANVNQLVDAGCWSDESDLAEAYTARKCFAYGVDGQPQKKAELLNSILGDVDLAYQNLESVELGVTTIDHYFDTLGGIGRAVKSAKQVDLPVYIGDQTRGNGTVRTLKEQVALESRTRTLNPKWYEGMLKHGYEGVRQIEAQVANTVGWSATTGEVAPWVYEEITETFVLDKALRNRMAALNPKACARVANRLIEASDRDYWRPDPATLQALQDIGEELEDRVEGLVPTEGL